MINLASPDLTLTFPDSHKSLDILLYQASRLTLLASQNLIQKQLQRRRPNIMLILSNHNNKCLLECIDLVIG